MFMDDKLCLTHPIVGRGFELDHAQDDNAAIVGRVADFGDYIAAAAQGQELRLDIEISESWAGGGLAMIRLESSVNADMSGAVVYWETDATALSNFTAGMKSPDLPMSTNPLFLFHFPAFVPANLNRYVQLSLHRTSTSLTGKIRSQVLLDVPSKDYGELGL